MNKILFMVLLITIIYGTLFSYENAEAMPIFSKKYSMACTVCHSSWPKLNRVGYNFKINGYQLPDGRDGSKKGKTSPAWDLHLDSGEANPPIGLRLTGGINLSQPSTDISGIQDRSHYCCTEPNKLTLYSAGTIKEDTGFFISYPLADGIDQGYLRFVNAYGQGYAGFDLGAFRTADFDVIPKGRNWFIDPDPAYYGNRSFMGRSQGQTSGNSDTGLRIFGNPKSGSFSYSFLQVTGGGKPGESFRGRGSATSAMGRYDGDSLGISIRYWEDESASLVFQRSAVRTIYNFNAPIGVPAIEFVPNLQNPDEKTSEFIFNLKYEKPRWQIEFVYDQNIINIKNRTDTTGTHTYSREAGFRDGASLTGIYRFSSTITGGIRFSNSTMKEFNETYDGTVQAIPSASVNITEIQFEHKPAQNARLAIQVSIDTSDKAARQRIENGAIIEYEQQNKLVLLWDWAI